MTDIIVRIPEAELAEAVQKVLMRGSPVSLHGNPFVTAFTAALQAEAPAIQARVAAVTREFVASDEFRKRIYAVYRDAMLGEAARMGRNAAKAIVNAKENA